MTIRNRFRFLPRLFLFSLGELHQALLILHVFSYSDFSYARQGKNKFTLAEAFDKICIEYSFKPKAEFLTFSDNITIISSLSANDLAVDAIVEHAAFVSFANILLTAHRDLQGILKGNANAHIR